MAVKNITFAQSSDFAAAMAAFESSKTPKTLGNGKEVKAAVPSAASFIEAARVEKEAAEKAEFIAWKTRMEAGTAAFSKKEERRAEAARRHEKALADLMAEEAKAQEARAIKAKEAELMELRLIARDIRRTYGRGRAWELAEGAVAACEAELAAMRPVLTQAPVAEAPVAEVAVKVTLADLRDGRTEVKEGRHTLTAKTERALSPRAFTAPETLVAIGGVEGKTLGSGKYCRPGAKKANKKCKKGK